MFNPSKLVRLALMSAPLLGIMASPALANVRSVNNASVCQWEEATARRAFKSDPENSFFSRYTADKGMYHTARADDGTTDLPVTCNIPRNLPLRTDGMSDLEVRLRATVPAATVFFRTVTCTAYSYRDDGTLAAAATRSLAVNMNETDTVPMDFGSAIGASGNKGFYLLSCSLPTEVSLFSIYSSENDGVSSN
jgi:hypothetical protein